MNDITYRQFGKPFVSYLSIIDVLMFNDVQEVRTLLREFSLEENRMPAYDAA